MLHNNVFQALRRSYRNFLDHGSAVPTNYTKVHDRIASVRQPNEMQHQTAWMNHLSQRPSYGMDDELTTSTQNYPEITTYSNPVVARSDTVMSSSGIAGLTYSQAFLPSTTTKLSFPIVIPTVPATSMKADNINPEMPTNNVTG